MVRNRNRTTSFSAGNSINSLTASLGSISLSSLTLDSSSSGDSSDSDTVREGAESGDDSDEGSIHSSLSTSEATDIISSFHSSSGIYSINSGSSVHDRKITLWQAILVGFGVCAPAEATSMTAVPNGCQDRPSHFEAYYLPLPNSANKCKELLKQYVHVNLKDFARLTTEAELFPRYASKLLSEAWLTLRTSSTKLIKYTFASRKFYKLNKAKEELLQPMLRDMRKRYR